MTKFTAPTGGESKKLEVEKIPSGMQLCTFYGLADLGTQETHFGQKRLCALHFEFPQQMRVFWEGDDPKPSAIYREITLSMHEKSALRSKFVEPMLGRKLTDEEAAVFDISTLLGKQFVATMADSPCGKYANIVSLSPLTEQNMLMFGLNSLNVPQINKTYFFHITMGFDSENFKNLPNFIREKLKASPEGQTFLLTGGVFNEPDEKEFKGNNNRKVVILPNSKYTYEQYKQAGWTDEQIVEQGFGKWENISITTLPKKELPPLPGDSPLKQNSVEKQVPSPLPPVVEKRKVKMINPQHNIEDWLKEGWTEETLVSEGYAQYINSANNPHGDVEVPF